MDSRVVTAIRSPLETLNSLFFEHHKGSLVQTVEKIETSFCKFLNESNANIPLLCHETHSQLPPWSLIRYRGMIQDMSSDTELCQVSVNATRHKTTLYQEDYAELFVSEGPTASSDYVERTSLHFIPLPGQSSWAHEEHLAQSALTLPTLSNANISIQNTSQASSSRKRGAEEEAEAPEAKRIDEKGLDGETRKMEAEDEDGKDGMDMDDAPKRTHCIDVVGKMYRWRDLNYKLNEMVDIIGLLQPSINKEARTASGEGSSAEEVMDDFLGGNVFDRLPGAVTYTVHIIDIRTLKQGIATVPLPVTTSRASLHNELCQFLGWVMGGDALAGTYLLLHMVSGVYDRKGLLAMGNFPVNFIGPSATKACEAAKGAINLLVERYCHLPLDLPTLRGASLVPTKDFGQECLRSGKLQLANGTRILIDETQLDEGQLGPAGIQGLKALAMIMESQHVEYDFKYHGLELEVDYPCAVFSNAASLFQKFACPIALRPQQDFVTRADIVQGGKWSGDMIGHWRTLIHEASSVAYEIPEAIRLELEKDVENEMKERPDVFQRSAVIQHNTLHTWFTVARLLAISKGESELTMETWKSTKELEVARYQRAKEGKSP